MLQLPAFLAPAQFTDAALALAQVQKIYNAQIDHLRSCMQQFVKGSQMTTQPRRKKFVLVTRLCGFIPTVYRAPICQI